jgi:hypothetical protein
MLCKDAASTGSWLFDCSLNLKVLIVMDPVTPPLLSFPFFR